MNHGARKGVWIRKILYKLLPKQAIRKMKMLKGNEMSLTLTKNPESQNCIKYIDVIHYSVQGLVEDRELWIE